MACKRAASPALSASTSEEGSSSEASPSEAEMPSSTSQFMSCESPEYDSETKEATDIIRKKLIETGRMDRLRHIMERKLSEIGWRNDMMAKCREVVKINGSATSFEMLFQALRKEGKDKVPQEIKEDMLLYIKQCYEAESSEK